MITEERFAANRLWRRVATLYPMGKVSLSITEVLDCSIRAFPPPFVLESSAWFLCFISDSRSHARRPAIELLRRQDALEDLHGSKRGRKITLYARGLLTFLRCFIAPFFVLANYRFPTTQATRRFLFVLWVSGLANLRCGVK